MPANVIMPQMGESVVEGTITKWLKKAGEHVDRDEPLFEITTDKVDAEIPSPAAGTIVQILVKENETVAVNTVVAVIDDGSAAVAVPLPETQEEAAPPVAAEDFMPPASGAPAIPLSSKDIRSSPLVRRIAQDYNVDLADVQGTGLGGRISKRDILAYVERRQMAVAVAASSPVVRPPSPPAHSAAPSGPVHVVPMTPMRRQIAEHMVASKRTSAHVYSVAEVEMTKVAEAKAQYSSEFQQRNGIKLTYTPFFVRAAVEAIREIPIINSSVEGMNIVYRHEVNIGIAVALETGLIVPVIKHADEKNFLGIAQAVHDFAERARSKRLTVDDVQGGTFTLTNPGSYGGIFGLPIINQPQVAILSVGVIEKRAVVRDDALAIRSMTYLALSYDHRVIDGAVGEQFLRRVKQILENWDEPVL